MESGLKNVGNELECYRGMTSYRWSGGWRVSLYSQMSWWRVSQLGTHSINPLFGEKGITPYRWHAPTDRSALPFASIGARSRASACALWTTTLSDLKRDSAADLSCASFAALSRALEVSFVLPVDVGTDSKFELWEKYDILH